MHPQMVLAAGQAARHAINLASQRMGHQHEQALAKLNAEVFEMMAKVTGAQIIAICENAKFVFGMLADDARHLMAERAEDKAVRRTSTDPVLRMELDSSIQRTNERLAEIQRGAQGLHAATCMFILRASEALGEAGKRLCLSADPVPLAPELSARVIDAEDDE
jgi:hypothetical protein